MKNCIARIEDFKGESMLTNIDDLQLKKYKYDCNSIYVSLIASNYPMIHILLKGNYAAIHFFEEECSAGHLSQGKEEFDCETVTFIDDEMGQEIDLPAGSVVTYEKAVLAAKEFVESHQKPTCISWLEL